MLTSRTGLRVLTLASLTAVVLAAAACHTPTLEDIFECSSIVTAADVSIEARDSTFAVGDTVRVSAVALNARGVIEYCAASLQYASSDPGVAMVSSDGLVTGLNTGSAYIRASSGTARDSLSIKVVASGAMR